MITSDAVASLRPRPFGPPLRGWAPRTDGIITGRPLGPPEHEEGNVGSTLRSSISGRRMGVGAARRGFLGLKAVDDMGGKIVCRSVFFSKEALDKIEEIITANQ